ARIAHCPDSNFFLGSGRMRVTEARRRGILVALGSDVAAGRTFSMQRAMSYAYDSALCAGPPLVPEDLFRMATRDGARALGFGDVAGTLEVGKEADFVVLDVPEHTHGLQHILSAIIFASDLTRVERVYVRGRRLD